MNRNNDNKDDKKEKLKKMLAELKENANGLSEDDLENLEKMLESYTDLGLMTGKNKFVAFILDFLKSFFVFYITSLLSIGFFISYLAFTNVYSIFLISLPVAFILAMLASVPLPNLFKSQIYDYILVFVILVSVIYVLNTFVYPIFTNSAVWVVYLSLAEIFGVLVNVWIVKLCMQRRSRK